MQLFRGQGDDLLFSANPQRSIIRGLCWQGHLLGLTQHGWAQMTSPSAPAR